MHLQAKISEPAKCAASQIPLLKTTKQQHLCQRGSFRDLMKDENIKSHLYTNRYLIVTRPNRDEYFEPNGASIIPISSIANYKPKSASPTRNSIGLWRTHIISTNCVQNHILELCIRRNFDWLMNQQTRTPTTRH
ncbi:unnamed protein product [Allacma fusca]|uniref:Uncharacterized protein n=1 Tax=Allacma fusca TaxID=39272 RepID=A0A8J2NYW9_9HEXA|nr:unnamed protein product [Allacma fusca]